MAVMAWPLGLGESMSKKPLWITIARDGDTTDGRHIPAQDLLDIASNFDPAIYLPKVNVVGSYAYHTIGEVYAVKVTTSEEITWLRALIRPDEHWFNTSTCPNLGNLQAQPIYPRLGYVKDRRPASERRWSTTFMSDLLLTAKPLYRDLEPLNKYMVKP